MLRDEPFSPRELARGGCGARSPRAREGKGLDAEIAIADDLPARVSGDAVRLRSALENLVDNAVKFTERGRVGVRGRRRRARRAGACG